MVLINDSTCLKCGLCQKLCPAGAIDLLSFSIDGGLCIGCFHCVAVCRTNSVTHQSLPPVEAVAAFPRRYELKNLILQRRSIRHYKNKQPDTALLKSFISDLRYSPTATNAQSLCFSLVTNPDVIQQVNDLTIHTFQKALKPLGNKWLAPLLRVLMGKAAYGRLNRYRLKFTELKNPRMVVYNAPAILAVHAPKDKNSLAAMDAAIWLGQAVLYAPSLGLGSCINGFVVKAAKRNRVIGDLLRVPNNHELHAVLLVGFPANSFVNLVERKDPQIAVVD